MTKVLYLFTILFLSSCVQTRHSLHEGQRVHVPSGSIVIVVPHEWASPDDYKNHFATIRDELATDCISLYHLDELDYDLRLEGINPDELKSWEPDALEGIRNWKSNVYLLRFENTLNKRRELEAKIENGRVREFEEVPDRKTIWVTSLYAPTDIHFWKFKTVVKANSTEYKGRNYNLRSDAYYLGLRKALKNLKKIAFAKCD